MQVETFRLKRENIKFPIDHLCYVGDPWLNLGTEKNI